MIALLYAKGSALLDRYLEMNGMKAVEIWRDFDRPSKFNVALVHESGKGWPEREPITLRDAKALAQRVAQHTGLPYIGRFD